MVVATLGMHEDYDLSSKRTERDPARFVVVPANVLARDRETVPYCIGPLKVEAMAAEVAATLPFVPGRHD